ADPATDRNELCREILTGLYYPGLAGADPATLRPAARIALMQLDPRNVTLEPEYYADIDGEAFARVKPLLWLLEMFDQSPLLDDRAPIVLGNGVSIADYANVYTHTHALADQRDVECRPVYLEDGVRVTYHAVILAGVRMQADSMIGTMGVATKDIESGKVALG